MKNIRRALLLLLSLLLLLPAVTFAEQTAAPDGTLACTFTGPDEVQSYLWHLSDGSAYTTVTVKRNETLRMQIENGTPTMLFFDFYERPEAFILTYLDADGNALGEEQYKAVDHHLLIPLEFGTLSAVELRLTGGNMPERGLLIKFDRYTGNRTGCSDCQRTARRKRINGAFFSVAHDI